MSEIKKRLERLERNRAARGSAQRLEPFWSEEHGCMMVNNGGFILPEVLTPES